MNDILSYCNLKYLCNKVSKGRKLAQWRTECLNTRFPSAYPAVCRIQRDAKKICFMLKHKYFS